LVVLKYKNLHQAKHPIIISGHIEGNNWTTWFYHNQIVEFVQFFAKLLTEKTPPGTRIQVTKDLFVGYVHPRLNGLSVCLICDGDYPSRVAFNILQKVVVDFDEQYAQKTKEFDAVTKDFELNHLYLETLKKIVQEYQDPVKTDKILKVKKDLEETKTVLNKALDSLLERGEKLDTLVEKTDMLSEGAKDFYIKARDSNSCCTIL